MPTPLATPVPADLDKQAAKLRDHAAGLNRREADLTERDEADFGQRLDEVQRSAASARAAAASATNQANELQDKAQEMMKVAKDFEDEALHMSADESNHDTRGPDNFRDQAKQLRASAAGMTGRAERAQHEARLQIETADRADRDAAQIKQAHMDKLNSDDAMRLTGTSLQDKAMELEEAADELRQANRAFTSDERAEHMGKAQTALARADAIKPDFSRISTDDILAAGIPLSEVPGAELMDPRSLVDPVNPGPVDIHDTDLMDPNAVDPVAPTSPAPAPVPGDVGDTDLMDPNASSSLPGAGTGAASDDAALVDPLGVTTPPTAAADGSGLDVDGDGLPDSSYDDPSQASVGRDSWDVDGGGQPDPLGGVTTDPGDFGLTGVEAPAPAVATASLGTDTYMDQPDVGSTDSSDAYGDAYGDSADSADSAEA